MTAARVADAKNNNPPDLAHRRVISAMISDAFPE
jgi:hypothetical protein